MFESIVHSTIWREPNHIRLVWITMLAMKDEDGVVEASVPGLMDAARVTRKEVDDALDHLASPDPDSRNPAHEGRRIAKTDGGWYLLNHEYYKNKMSKQEKAERTRELGRLRQRKHRLRDADLPEGGGPCAYCGDDATGPDHVIPKTQGGEDVVLCCPRCNQTKASSRVVDFLNWHPEFVGTSLVMSSPVLRKHVTYNGSKFIPVTHPSQAVTINNAKPPIRSDQIIPDQIIDKTKSAPADGFDAFWSAYPKKAARKDALKAWGQTAKERPPIDVLLRAIRRQLQGRQWQDGIYSHAATWLRGERWNDEPERGGPMVGRPQPKEQVEVDDGPAATDEQKAAAFKAIRGKLGMNPFTAEGEGT